MRTTTSPRPGSGSARSTNPNFRGACSTAAWLLALICCCGRSFAPHVNGEVSEGPPRPLRSGESHHDGDFFDWEVRNDLGAVGVDDQHLLDAHAELVALTVLRLQREDHPGPDLERMIERPDARDHGWIVLGEPQTVAPQVGRGLVLLVVAPRFLRRRPLERDVARGGARPYLADRVVEP